MFDPDSGWCTCGVRDDGADAFGSPAWRRRVESALPDASSQQVPACVADPSAQNGEPS